MPVVVLRTCQKQLQSCTLYSTWLGPRRTAISIIFLLVFGILRREGLKGQGPRRSTIISVHDYRHFQSSVGDTLAWHFPGPSSSSTLHALYSYTAGHLHLSGRLHDLFSLSYLFLCTFCLKFDLIANTVQCSKFEQIARKANRPITFKSCSLQVM